MFHKALLGVIPACFLLFPAMPASGAAFALPDNAVIDVKQFTFPPTPADAGERNLQETFRDQIVFSLQQSGFAVLDERTGAPLAPPVAEAKDFSSSADAALQVTPIFDGDEHEQDAEIPSADTPATDSAAPDAAGTAPGGNPAMPGAEPPAQAVPEKPAAPAYTLSGRVTLLRENVGTPTRIGADIRIRTEASLHVIYHIVDTTTGNVIISDVVSGSVARVTSETKDIDGALAALTGKVMADSAAKIAASLSGMPIDDDEDYYRDSPGKRLKPGK